MRGFLFERRYWNPQQAGREFQKAPVVFRRACFD
jgi:hypothetical protein